MFKSTLEAAKPLLGISPVGPLSMKLYSAHHTSTTQQSVTISLQGTTTGVYALPVKFRSLGSRVCVCVHPAPHTPAMQLQLGEGTSCTAAGRTTVPSRKMGPPPPAGCATTCIRQATLPPVNTHSPQIPGTSQQGKAGPPAEVQCTHNAHNNGCTGSTGVRAGHPMGTLSVCLPLAPSKYV